MKEGDILLTALRQADGLMKDRPVLVLKRMPPYQYFLVCGLSTQFQHAVADFDEVIGPGDSDYPTSHLKATSLNRLSFLAVIPRVQCKGRIGSVSSARLDRLLIRLSDFLRPGS